MKEVGRVVSLNVGMPREIEWAGRRVVTGIFKAPVHGRLMLRTLHFDGDGQADLSVHGGVAKAAYAYPEQHYEFWKNELSSAGWPWGMFGENLTVSGLDERTVRVGDLFRIGSAELMVSQPRLPCFKLGIKFGREDMPQRFLDSGRTGFYFRVANEGEIGAGDGIEQIGSEQESLTIRRAVELYLASEFTDQEIADLRIAARLAPLSDRWRAHFAEKLRQVSGFR